MACGQRRVEIDGDENLVVDMLFGGSGRRGCRGMNCVLPTAPASQDEHLGLEVYTMERTGCWVCGFMLCFVVKWKGQGRQDSDKGLVGLFG